MTHSLPRLKRYTFALALFWTLIVLASVGWNLYQVHNQITEIARVQARVAYDKDIIFRRWASQHGGVYVPVTETTQPNSYLQIAERDITTPSGKALTLLNPAYMTRQVFELQNADLGVRGHITSLQPIRPQNAADEWETQALHEFERGVREVNEITQLAGTAYMRLMRPLLTEESCLKCHAAQGYRVGDIRGGISVAIPMEPLWQIQTRNNQSLGLAHVILWGLGLLGILGGSARIEKSESERAHAEERLRFISSHDALSGLYNRASYEDQVAKLKQDGHAPISVMMIDLDGLKDVNDSLGHAAGDELIKRAARVLKAGIRTDDIVARIGGDEFVILLPGASMQAAQQVLVRLKMQLIHDNLAQESAPLSLSVGLATAETNNMLDHVIKLADERMYAEKKSHAARAGKESR